MDAKKLLEELYEDIPASALIPTPMKKSYSDPSLIPKMPPPFIPIPSPTELVQVLVAEDQSEQERATEEAREKEVAQQKHFLEAYLRTYNPTAAAVVAKVPLMSVARWRKNPVFDEIYGQVEKVILNTLEAEAVRRGFEGSDRLLIKMLESMDPKKYGRTTRITGTGPDGALNVNVTSWQELARTAAISPEERATALEVVDDVCAVSLDDDDDDEDDLPPRVGVRGAEGGDSGQPLVWEVFATEDE